MKFLNLSVTDESLKPKICNTCRVRVIQLHKDTEKKVNFTVNNYLQYFKKLISLNLNKLLKYEVTVVYIFFRMKMFMAMI